MAGINDPIIPEPRRGIERVALLFKHINRGLFECGFFLGTPCATRAFNPVAFDGGQNARRLCTAHHRNATVGPCPQNRG